MTQCKNFQASSALTRLYGAVQYLWVRPEGTLLNQILSLTAASSVPDKIRKFIVGNLVTPAAQLCMAWMSNKST